ncbi:MAG: putative porin [Gammaproteobacteria bacterium]|nr:putative porin [Gammaproteobacteria bacterium]
MKEKKSMRTRAWFPLILGVLNAAAAGSAPADELEELRSLRDTTIALVNALVQQGVLTREKADELIRKAEQAGKGQGSPEAAGAAPVPAPQPAAPSSPPAPDVIRVPYVPQTVREEIRDEVKQEVLAQAKQERWGEPGALPRWLDHVSLGGDIRVRGQADRFPSSSEPNATPQQLQQPAFGAYNINNTSDPRNRLRVRVRFGAEAKVSDAVTAVVRITTGTAGTGGDPSSENENLGNYNARGNVGFDLAYITYQPTSWLHFTGGRLGNPFFAPTTLVWADDLSLQGVLMALTPHFTPDFQGFATTGAFPIQEIEPTPLTRARSKWMWAYQAGFKWQLVPSINWALGGALYDYRRLEGIPNPSIIPSDTPYSLTAAPFRQKGNTVFDINELSNAANGTTNYLIGLASKFKELNIASTLDLDAFADKHVLLTADYVKNLGYHHAEILARTGLDVPNETRGLQGRVAFGDPSFEHRYAWQAWLGYRHVENDAVVDAFTDSDFRLGGTDATGYYLGARYAYEPNSTIGLRWFSAKQIDCRFQCLPLSIDVLQLDWIAAF